MSYVDRPSDAAAYKEKEVTVYSWMNSGRQMGSEMAMRKSYAFW